MFSKTIFVLILLALNQAENTVNGQEEHEEDEQREPYVTCDFDLVETYPGILDELPKECQQIAADDEYQYNQMRAESLLFEEFMEELDQKDREDPSYVEGETKNWEIRKDTYTNADLHDCLNRTSSTEFIVCMSEQRQIMIDEIKTKS